MNQREAKSCTQRTPQSLDRKEAPSTATALALPCLDAGHCCFRSLHEACRRGNGGSDKLGCLVLPDSFLSFPVSSGLAWGLQLRAYLALALERRVFICQNAHRKAHSHLQVRVTAAYLPKVHSWSICQPLGAPVTSASPGLRAEAVSLTPF